MEKKEFDDLIVSHLYKKFGEGIVFLDYIDEKDKFLFETFGIKDRDSLLKHLVADEWFYSNSQLKVNRKCRELEVSKEGNQRLKIKYTKFERIVYKNSYNIVEGSKVSIYGEYPRQMVIHIDLVNGVFSSIVNKNKNNTIPVTFANSYYTIREKELFQILSEILSYLGANRTLCCPSLLEHFPSNNNIIDILKFQKTRDFYRTLLKLEYVPKWAYKTSPLLLRIYTKIIKKTRDDSKGFIKNYFNHHFEILNELIKKKAFLESEEPIEENLVRHIFHQRINNITEDNESILKDYIRVVFTRNFRECCFNFKATSMLKIYEAHDNIFRVIRISSVKKIKTHKYQYTSEYQKLISELAKSGLNIKPMKTNRELLYFSGEMNNCAFGDDIAIRNNRSIIMKGVSENKEVHCIRFKLMKNKFMLHEIFQKHNNPADKKFINQIQLFLENFNLNFQLKNNKQ
ncbi:hypothetical protein [Riemerella anatipestifer]|uniref:hypothetical protein n=1 Tax=Riemerella anatipestifer TaxID=34085 RepID=UPI0021F8BC5B|nr:hypothetical protein [Riemerella anatipestifer]MCW0488315.1 hypothetical protein [Riemerella anatipestifer]